MSEADVFFLLIDVEKAHRLVVFGGKQRDCLRLALAAQPACSRQTRMDDAALHRGIDAVYPNGIRVIPPKKTPGMGTHSVCF